MAPVSRQASLRSSLALHGIVVDVTLDAVHVTATRPIPLSSPMWPLLNAGVLEALFHNATEDDPATGTGDDDDRRLLRAARNIFGDADRDD